MTILNLVSYKDPILHNPTESFDFENPQIDPILLAKDLTETMLKHEALGLASNQVGIPYSVFSVRANPVMVLFNPIIVNTSDDQIEMPEGCLSFRGVLLKKKRSKSIKIRYRYPNGETVTEKYTDLTARIIQHEMDHLLGITFIDDLSKLKKDMIFKKANKILRERYYFVS